MAERWRVPYELDNFAHTHVHASNIHGSIGLLARRTTPGDRGDRGLFLHRLGFCSGSGRGGRGGGGGRGRGSLGSLGLRFAFLKIYLPGTWNENTAAIPAQIPLRCAEEEELKNGS
jgi:hypothetical protein